ncbi:hypothetical protein [Micromonospora sp. NPDC049274]
MRQPRRAASLTVGDVTLGRLGYAPVCEVASEFHETAGWRGASHLLVERW